MTGAPEVVTIGETLASLRASGDLRVATPVSLSIAGAESNVAIGLARLGHAVRWAGVVGDDAFGRLITRTLRGEGVQTSSRTIASPTGMIVFTARPPTAITVDYHRRASAGSALDLADVEAAMADPPRILHLTGITPALSPSALAAVRAAIDRASEQGVKVCLDVNYRSRLWSRAEARATIAPLAARADLIIASDDELGLAVDVPSTDPRTGIDTLLGHATAVIVKRGSHGAAAYTRAGEVQVDAVAVSAIDPVGAGDAFVAGFLSGTLDGLPLVECMQRGALLGAFAVASIGDWEGLPLRTDLGRLDEEGVIR